MKKLQPILYAIGVLLTLLSGAMAIPALVDLANSNKDWEAFAASAFLTAFFGGSLILTNRGFQGTIGIKQAFMLTTFSWIVIAAFGALPFMIGNLDASFTDAYFESMSGLTTTGSTVFTGLDTLAPGILLWRAILTGLGGIGIIVMAITILPMLKIGGMQLFRTESSDRSDKIMPRATQIARSIIVTYASLVTACVFFLCMAGMSFFDAVCHAIPAISTAGFSNYDTSISHFNSPHIEFVLIIFMLLGAMPFVHYIHFVRGNATPLIRDKQVRSFLAMVALSIILITLWAYEVQEIPFVLALRHSAFSVVSIITTTGFSSVDYMKWGSFVIVMLFVLTVFGGCTGSTTGGIKTFRLMVLVEIAKSQIHQLIQPHVISRPTYNNKPISDNDVTSVMGFIVLWGVTFTIFSILLSATGLDFITSLSAVAAAMANTGPGLGPIVGPAGTYAPLPDAAKWVLSAAMLVGRLELFSVLVFFSLRFWRD